MKLVRIVSLICLLAAGGLYFLGNFIFPPPSDEKLIKSFYENRVAFERLRDLITADAVNRNVVQIWENSGVQTKNSIGAFVPPKGEFPVERYNEYLALFKETGGLDVAVFGNEIPPEICINVWRTGFAESSQHISVCWESQVPPPKDTMPENSEPRPWYSPARSFSENFEYRHIDGNWFLHYMYASR